MASLGKANLAHTLKSAQCTKADPTFTFEPGRSQRGSGLHIKLEMFVVSCTSVKILRFRWCWKTNNLKFNIQMESPKNIFYLLLYDHLKLNLLLKIEHELQINFSLHLLLAFAR